METPQEFVEKWSQNGLGWWDRLFMWLSMIFVFVGTGLVVFEFWNQPGKGVVPILLAGIACILVRLVAIAEGLLVDVEDLQVIDQRKGGPGLKPDQATTPPILESEDLPFEYDRSQLT